MHVTKTYCTCMCCATDAANIDAILLIIIVLESRSIRAIYIFFFKNSISSCPKIKISK